MPGGGHFGWAVATVVSRLMPGAGKTPGHEVQHRQRQQPPHNTHRAPGSAASADGSGGPQTARPSRSARPGTRPDGQGQLLGQGVDPRQLLDQLGLLLRDGPWSRGPVPFFDVRGQLGPDQVAGARQSRRSASDSWTVAGPGWLRLVRDVRTLPDGTGGVRVRSPRKLLGHGGPDDHGELGDDERQPRLSSGCRCRSGQPAVRTSSPIAAGRARPCSRSCPRAVQQQRLDTRARSTS